jgi:PAS domain S-box-containing protein
MIAPKILVVDDSRVNLMVYQKLIGRHLPDCRLELAMDAEQALCAIQAEPPDCALLDVFMPGLSGIALCRAIKARKDFSSFPILLITAQGATAALRVEGLEAGADDFIQRPCEDVDLVAKLRVMLRIKRAEDELRAANRRLASVAGERSSELQSAQERCQHLMEHGTDAVLMLVVEPTGMPGPIIEANPALCRLSGYSREELLALPFSALTTRERLQNIEARMQSILQYRQVYYETELYTAHRRVVPLGVNARLLEHAGGRVALLLGHVLDGAPAAQPNPLEVPYPDLAAQTGQVIYELDIEVGYARWGGATMQVFGFTRHEMERQGIREWQRRLHPDERRRVLRMFQQALNSVSRYQLEYRLRNREGEYRHLEDLGVVLMDEAGRPNRLLGTIKDITARVRAEEERRQLEQGMQHAQRLESLGVLAGGIAHDFNNILSAIIGLTDISLQQLPQDTEVYADLSEALNAAHRAKDLVRQILAFSRQSSAERSPIYLHVVAREVLKLLRASLSPMIDIIDSVDVRSGAVMANPAQMHQIIMNFCTNAAQAMAARGGTLEVRLEDVQLDEGTAPPHPRLPPGAYVKLSVCDTGHGMTEAVLKRIFDPFFTTKGPGEGTGMGLAVVDGIVASHNGAVTAESRPGAGSAFHVWLPKVEAPQAEAERVRGSMPVGTERILFVDDEDIVLRFGESTLNRLGYPIALFRDPGDALAAFRDAPEAYDLIITDQIMPTMTGYQFAKAVRALRPDIPIILFTGFSADVSDKEFQEAGIDEIVMKPVIAMDLAQTIRATLDRPRRGSAAP